MLHCSLISPAPKASGVRGKPIFLPLEKRHTCSNLREIQMLHAQLVTTGFIGHIPSLNNLLSLSLDISSSPEAGDRLAYACKLFDGTRHSSVLLWNTMIRGLLNLGFHVAALRAFADMLEDSKFLPDRFTFPSLFKACARLAALFEGRTLHGQAIRADLVDDIYAQSTLISMYAECGDLRSARDVFDRMEGGRNQVAWSSMITGYAKNHRPEEALSLFLEMEERGQEPDEVTVTSAISACAQLGDLEHGKRLHSRTELSGGSECVVLGTALVDMYAKCGALGMARKVFDEMPKKNVVTWSAMISGYAQNDRCEEAVRLFEAMVVESDAMPNEVTLKAALSACAQLGDLETGRMIHAYIGKVQPDCSTGLQNSMMDMYSKCGRIDLACEIFDGIAERDVVSWNVVIAGLGRHGLGRLAVEKFHLMGAAGVRPDDITFIAVLSACSHAGLVEEGRGCYREMSEKYAITPKLEHHGCMVDLFCRAGMLDEAKNFIGEELAVEPQEAIWGALLSGCRARGDVELGVDAAGRLLDVEPRGDGVYVLLSNMLEDAKRWEDARRVRALMHERGIRKRPGCSSIEVGGVLHEFMAGDHGSGWDS